ncbi:MAG: hypothetical protein CL917_14890, partial [Deltaproteobacteria bacterium]|nr:hypothetical protein [Deltaproteobacteria bacterium]
CIPSRKMLVDRLYPALSRHEIATAQGEAIQLRWESQMKQAADELQATLTGHALRSRRSASREGSDHRPHERS